MTEKKTPPLPTVFCEEVFDENSLPSEDEIRDYAVKIGIQPDKEPQLLSLAKDGLMKALPNGWTPCFDQRKKAWYYFNYENGTSQWEHPLDSVYRDLVQKTRQESLSSGADDISSIRDDLKSLDENNIYSGALLRRATNQLGPLKSLPSKLDPIFMMDKNKLLAPNFKMTPRPPPSPTPGGTEEAALVNNTVDDTQKMTKGWTELTISGGGSSFLKKVVPQQSTESSSSEGADEKAVTIVKSSLEPTRGILRDKSPQRLQGGGSFEQKSDGEEDKKSVRFNLEDGTGVQIRLFEEEDSEEKESSIDKLQEEKVKIVVQAPDFDFMAELDDDEDVWISDEEEKAKETNQNINDTKALGSMITEEIIPTNGNEPGNQTTESKFNLEAENQKILNDMNERISKLRECLELEEMEKTQRLREDQEAKLQQVQLKIETELKNREKNIRDGAERTLEKLRDELASTMEKQLSAIKVEKQVAIDLEKSEIKKHRESLAANLSRLKEDLEAEYELKMEEESGALRKEHENKLDRLRNQIKFTYSKEVSTVENQLLEQRRLKQANLEQELQHKEEDLASKLQEQFEQRHKEKKSELEKQLKDDLARIQREAQSEKHKKMVALKEEMDRQLESARQGFREDHNKALDKMKTDQLIAVESLRMTLQKEEEKMHVAHRAKLAALSEKLNVEYESRLKRLKEIADRKAKLLIEEDARGAKYDQGGAGSISRNFSDVESFNNQRCEHLQRQIELLSIKLKDCRKQLEEARALRPDDRVFEKLRCEKRLLEDKYRTLKDKYVRLKSDVKQTLEKRNKKRLAVTGGGATTGSETDRSSSQRLGQVKSRIKIIAPPDDISSEANNNNNSGSGVDNTMASSLKESLVVSPPPTDSSDRTSPPLPLRRARRHQSKLKSSSTPRLDRGRDAALNPVDNLRTQLQKLEDLEDLFPASTHVDTYLRYPFEESGQMGSCELEFFRHRIHLERDSVQKAKAFLKQQRHTFANRQRELHKRQSQITLSPSPTSSRLHSELAKDSIIQEERELSEMEVSLHRTRSLLGEKIIRLRQLEHSLTQLSANRNKGTDATLSDLSSHSGSSGFSSNDNPNELKIGLANKGAKCTESNEIIRSLETLNSEIRSLWDLLQRHSAEKLPAGPPPLLVPGSESPWPALTALAEQLQQIRLQQQVAAVANNNLSTVSVSGSAVSLAERAQGLRDWLRRTKLDSAVQTNSSKN